MEKLKQELRLVPYDVINGFSPSFTRALLEKLKELKKTQRLFTENKQPTLIATAVISNLEKQIFTEVVFNPNDGDIKWVDEIIKATEEFLTLFELAKASEPTMVFEPKMFEEIPISEEFVKGISKFGEAGIPEEHNGGFRTDLSPCHQAPIEITKGGLRQEICSKCKKPIRESQFKYSGFNSFE